MGKHKKASKKKLELKHLGRIKITTNVIESFNLATEIFRQLGFVPWQVEYLPQDEVFLMLGTSPMFHVIELDAPAPFYHITVHDTINEDGTHSLSLTCTEQAEQVILTDKLTPASAVVGGKQ